MNFDEETLLEIEDYINALDDNVGLMPGTLTDILNAINLQRKKLKTLTIPDVSKVKREVCLEKRKRLYCKTYLINHRCPTTCTLLKQTDR
jgi:hypothetical protein